MKDFFKKVGNTEIRNVLAIITTLGTFILLYLLIIKPVPADNKEIVNIAVGFVFGGALGAVFGFFFGSSKDTKTIDPPTPTSTTQESK